MASSALAALAARFAVTLSARKRACRARAAALRAEYRATPPLEIPQSRVAGEGIARAR